MLNYWCENVDQMHRYVWCEFPQIIANCHEGL